MDDPSLPLTTSTSSANDVDSLSPQILESKWSNIFLKLSNLSSGFKAPKSPGIPFSEKEMVSSAIKILESRKFINPKIFHIHIGGSSSYNLRNPSSDEDLLIVFSHPLAKKGSYHHKKIDPDFAAYQPAKFVESFLKSKPSIPNFEALFSDRYSITTPFFSELKQRRNQFLLLATVGCYLGWGKTSLKTAKKHNDKEWNAESPSKIFKSLYQTFRCCFEAKRILLGKIPQIWWPQDNPKRNVLLWIRSLSRGYNPKNLEDTKSLAITLFNHAENMIETTYSLKGLNPTNLADSISEETRQFLEDWVQRAVTTDDRIVIDQ